jgi:hypothetical protein
MAGKILEKMKRLCSLAFVAATVAACSGSDPIADSIHQQFKQSGKRLINLDRAVPGAWKRVCVIGPYEDDATTHAALGFKWHGKTISNVAADDGLVLLVFVDDADNVAFFANYSRGKGDFSNLSRQCFARSQAIFEQVDKPQKGWPGLFPKKA